MLSNFSQYGLQGLAPQIPGLQGIGVPQFNSGLGQPVPYGNAWSGHEPGQQVPVLLGQANPFGHNPVQMIPALLQLAQQLAIQCAITQQIAQQVSVATQQLANQLGTQGLQGLQGLQGQYYGQNPYAPFVQGGYPGFNPQVQAWGANRQATIQ